MKHPIYLIICMVAAGYLALANARGWDPLVPFHRMTQGGGGGAYGGVHHK